MTADYPPAAVYFDADLPTDPADQPIQRPAMTAARHDQVARDLDLVAWAYEVKARPFRARAEEHRQAARQQRGEL